MGKLRGGGGMRNFYMLKIKVGRKANPGMEGKIFLGKTQRWKEKKFFKGKERKRFGFPL